MHNSKTTLRLPKLPLIDRLTELKLPLIDHLTELKLPLIDRLTELKLPLIDRLTELKLPLIDRLTELKLPLIDRLMELKLPLIDRLTDISEICGCADFINSSIAPQLSDKILTLFLHFHLQVLCEPIHFLVASLA
jgi:hypothetical protein